ncbi:hypothetical protein ACFQ1E_18155 [Sphingomonas canadensis]|uniref:Uncharacterized protein n=1 Tax=Sphingomonas canadensis TaxID=1219257 RepID=A0ABW3H9Z4_9SPHN|nr:hypothetical protein [Sphingomonas canadensis]
MPPVLAAVLAAASVPARAQGGPEQLDQLEPGAGEWQLEYAGVFGGDGEQELEALFALSDRFAIGATAEFEGPGGGIRLDAIGAKALYRMIDPDGHPIGLGIGAEAAVSADGSFAAGEVRLIAESRPARWWIQADAILRHAREDGLGGTGIAYAGSVQRGLGSAAWLGIEASGQVLRIAGDPGLAPRGQHYIGPSLTFEREMAKGNEAEIGIAWLERVRGQGPGSGPRIFVQLTF